MSPSWFGSPNVAISITTLQHLMGFKNVTQEPNMIGYVDMLHMHMY